MTATGFLLTLECVREGFCREHYVLDGVSSDSVLGPHIGHNNMHV